MRRAILLSSLFAASAMMAFVAAAQQSVVTSTSTTKPSLSKTSKADGSTASKATPIHVEPSMRIEGEKRFRENCSRCHMAPQKLPPRAAATIIRHMRVRATITDEDMRYILAYLAQ